MTRATVRVAARLLPAAVLTALLVVCVAPVLPASQSRLHAQAAAADAPKGEATKGAGKGGDAWNFGDEEEAAPTVGQIARGQVVELTAFAAFAALAMTGFFLKNEKLKIATLVASVGYLGFYESQLISVVNIFGLLKLNLPVLKFNLPWYFFAIFTLGTTLLWGRVYCGRVCAFGAFTQLMDTVLPKKLRVDVPRAIEQRAAYIKYGILVAVCAYFLSTSDISIFRYVEPFWMFTRTSTPVLWTMLAALLIATVFIRNLYCRFLCPVGAFLAIISQVTTVFRIKRWAECKSCKICEKTCEWGAIRGPVIVRSECVRCDDCERLYMDQKKCPHWLIQIKKRRDFTSSPGTPPGTAPAST